MVGAPGLDRFTGPQVSPANGDGRHARGPAGLHVAKISGEVTVASIILRSLRLPLESNAAPLSLKRYCATSCGVLLGMVAVIPATIWAEVRATDQIRTAPNRASA